MSNSKRKLSWGRNKSSPAGSSSTPILQEYHAAYNSAAASTSATASSSAAASNSAAASTSDADYNSTTASNSAGNQIANPTILPQVKAINADEALVMRAFAPVNPIYAAAFNSLEDAVSNSADQPDPQPMVTSTDANGANCSEADAVSLQETDENNETL